MNEVQRYEDWLRLKKAERDVIEIRAKEYTYLALAENVRLAIGNGSTLLVGVKWED